MAPLKAMNKTLHATQTHPLLTSAKEWGFPEQIAQRALDMLQEQMGGTAAKNLTAAAHQDQFLEICIALNADEHYQDEDRMQDQSNPAGLSSTSSEQEDSGTEQLTEEDGSDDEDNASSEQLSVDDTDDNSSSSSSSSEDDVPLSVRKRGRQQLTPPAKRSRGRPAGAAGFISAAQLKDDMLSSSNSGSETDNETVNARPAVHQGGGIDDAQPITLDELDELELSQQPPALMPAPTTTAKGRGQHRVILDSDSEGDQPGVTTNRTDPVRGDSRSRANLHGGLTTDMSKPALQRHATIDLTAGCHAQQAARDGQKRQGGAGNDIRAWMTRIPQGNGQQGRQLSWCATADEMAAAQQPTPMALADMVNCRVFGNSSWREAQRDVVQAALAGRNVFVLMPTGGGKSLCYQLPGVMSQGVTVVVCPLLSLMQDQVQALCKGRPGGCGIPAAYLSSAQSRAETLAVLRELNKQRPSCKLLYVTPEQLVKSTVLLDILQRLDSRQRLARIVVDEAHCVSIWGHDFRPDYKQLGNMMQSKFPGVPVTAVTATATAAVADDIQTTLGMKHDTARFKVSFFRPNLTFSIRDKVYGVDELDRPQPLAGLIDFIHEQHAIAASIHQQQAVQGAPHMAAGVRGVVAQPHSHRQQPRFATARQACPPSGIVYCLSRDECEQVARALQELGGITAAHYHAGMTNKQRTKVQTAWQEGRFSVVCSTIAFGMGIDKPDVRFVAHYTLSKSLEGYFQEAGRAGRDGLPSECVIFYAKRDNPRILQLLRIGARGNNTYQTGVKLLEAMKDYCEDLTRCRHDILMGYFDDDTRHTRLQQGPGGSVGCGGCCDNCKERLNPGSGGRAEARGNGSNTEGNKRSKKDSKGSKRKRGGSSAKAGNNSDDGFDGGDFDYEYIASDDDMQQQQHDVRRTGANNSEDNDTSHTHTAGTNRQQSIVQTLGGFQRASDLLALVGQGADYEEATMKGNGSKSRKTTDKSKKPGKGKASQAPVGHNQTIVAAFAAANKKKDMQCTTQAQQQQQQNMNDDEGDTPRGQFARPAPIAAAAAAAMRRLESSGKTEILQTIPAKIAGNGNDARAHVFEPATSLSSLLGVARQNGSLKQKQSDNQPPPSGPSSHDGQSLTGGAFKNPFKHRHNQNSAAAALSAQAPTNSNTLIGGAKSTQGAENATGIRSVLSVVTNSTSSSNVNTATASSRAAALVSKAAKDGDRMRARQLQELRQAQLGSLGNNSLIQPSQ